MLALVASAHAFSPPVSQTSMTRVMIGNDARASMSTMLIPAALRLPLAAAAGAGATAAYVTWRERRNQAEDVPKDPLLEYQESIQATRVEIELSSLQRALYKSEERVRATEEELSTLLEEQAKTSTELSAAKRMADRLENEAGRLAASLSQKTMEAERMEASLRAELEQAQQEMMQLRETVAEMKLTNTERKLAAPAMA